jgi:hypothetical protein
LTTAFGSTCLPSTCPSFISAISHLDTSTMFELMAPGRRDADRVAVVRDRYSSVVSRRSVYGTPGSAVFSIASIENVVLVMPSGVRMRSRTNVSHGFPDSSSMA